MDLSLSDSLIVNVLPQIWPANFHATKPVSCDFVLDNIAEDLNQNPPKILHYRAKQSPDEKYQACSQTFVLEGSNLRPQNTKNIAYPKNQFFLKPLF